MPHLGALPALIPPSTGGVSIGSPSWSGSMTVSTTGLTNIRISLGGATALNLSAGTDSQRILVELKQSTASSIVTWGANIAWGTDIPSVTLSTTLNAVDYLGFIYDGTASKWRCIAFARGY
jgi:hypothetical protein